MTTAFLALILVAGIPTPVAQAITVFNNGEIYLREINMEPETDFRRKSPTYIPCYAEGCEGSVELDWELDLWNTTMLKLWNSKNTAETNFTVRAGDEYLVYDSFLLFYTYPDGRCGIPIHPEELWAVLNHLGRNPSAATSQISVEGWYPGLNEPLTAFITQYDPVYEVIQELLERGREATPVE